MQFKSKTILEYISQLTEDRKEPISKLRNIINQNIDRGFSEEINYGMIGWWYLIPFIQRGIIATRSCPCPL